MPAADSVSIPRPLAVLLYSAAQAQPAAVVRGSIVDSMEGLVVVPDGARVAGTPFAAFLSQPEGSPAPDRAELERLLHAAPLVLIVSRATRGVMVLMGHRRSATGIETVQVRIQDADREAV